VAWIASLGLKVDILINNAGFGDSGTFETSDWEKVRGMLMVNMVALTELTHRLLPEMIKNDEGTIINVASTAGFLPIPTLAVYAATKAYVCSLSEALYTELQGTGVTVTSLCPGPVPTEFSHVANRPDSARLFQPPQWMQVSAADAVKQTLCAAKKGRARVIPGWMVKVPILMVEALPVPLLRAVWGIKQKMFS
jgi:short-subunit dehydrogenase